MGAAEQYLAVVGAIGRSVQSLYGPAKNRKQITTSADEELFTADAFEVFEALPCDHPAYYVLQEAMHKHMKQYGTGCTFMLNLSGLFASKIMDMLAQRVPRHTIVEALELVHSTWVRSIKLMRIDIGDIPSLSRLSDTTRNDMARQSQVLAQGLQCRYDDDYENGGLSPAMALALEAFMLLQRDQRDITKAQLHVEAAVGPLAERSHVVAGALVRLDEDNSFSRLRKLLWSSAASSYTKTIRNVALLSGDLWDVAEATTHLCRLNISLIIVSGDVDDVVTDALLQRDILVMMISKERDLGRISELVGATAVETISDLMPSAVGGYSVRVSLVEFDKDIIPSIKNSEEDSEIRFRKYLQIETCGHRVPPQVSVLVHGVTTSTARELGVQVQRHFARLRNAKQDGVVIPGGGSLICACIALLRQEPPVDIEMHQAVGRFVAALTQLAQLQLENEGTSYLESRRQVDKVIHRYANDMADVGVQRFFEICPFHHPEYAVGSSQHDGGGVFQCYTATRAAITTSMRVLTLMTTVDEELVGKNS